MARRGRNRLDGERYPSGQIRAVEPTPAGEYARARRNYIRGLRDPLYGTEAGLLQLEGKLSPEQRESGEKWVSIVEDRQRIVMDQPQARPKPCSMEPHIPGNQGREYDIDLIHKIEDRHAAAFSAIIDGKNGMASLRAINKLFIDNEMLDYSERENAKPGLDRLSVIFAIDKRGKS